MCFIFLINQFDMKACKASVSLCLLWAGKKATFPALLSLTMGCSVVAIFLLSAQKLAWSRLLEFLKLSFAGHYKGNVSFGQMLQRTNTWRKLTAFRADPSWQMYTCITIGTTLLPNTWQWKLATGMGVSPWLYIQGIQPGVYIKYVAHPPRIVLGSFCPDLGEHEC